MVYKKTIKLSHNEIMSLSKAMNLIENKNKIDQELQIKIEEMKDDLSGGY